MSDHVSPVTGEEPYSGPASAVISLLRVMNIGEGKMAQLTQPDVEFYQEMVDRDCDAILSAAYFCPIRSYNQVQPVDNGVLPSPGHSAGGVVAITPGTNVVVVSGQAWNFLPTIVVAAVLSTTGGFNVFATVEENTITMDGFTADLSAAAGAGYSLSWLVSEPGTPGTHMIGTGTQVRVFPGDVRRAALYWTAGQILISEFQQLEANLTEQATQMVADARMQVFAMTRPNHRIPGQRRLSTISRTMPSNLQPNAFPERPS